MNNKLRKQFEFEYWSNRLILESLKMSDPKSERGIHLFSNLLSSHSMWLSRVTKTEFTCTLFQERTFDECEKLMVENLTGWHNYLENKSMSDLEEPIEFMSTWEMTTHKKRISIEDAIIHIINHSSYHRGQIIADLRDKVDQLPLTTYIMFASDLIE